MPAVQLLYYILFKFDSLSEIQYTTGHMEEGKKVLAVFLVVLFFIIVLGVIVSRTGQLRKNTPSKGGSLESIIFPNRPTKQPTIVIAQKSNEKGGLTQEIEKSTTPGVTTPGVTGAASPQPSQKIALKLPSNTPKVTPKPKPTKSTSETLAKAQPTKSIQPTAKALTSYQLSQQPVVVGDSTDSTTTSQAEAIAGETTADTAYPDSTKGGLQNAQNIPETGSPTILLELAFAGLASGMLLKRKS